MVTARPRTRETKAVLANQRPARGRARRCTLATVMRVVLASSSRYRRALVERLGIVVEPVTPPYDEEAAKDALGATSVEAMTQHLARGKAESLVAACPDALIIGADQAAEVDGEILGKPGSA